MEKRYRIDIDRGFAITEIAKTTNCVLGNDSHASYFTIDTAFARSAKPVWEWFSNQLQPLLASAREISELSNPHRFGRLVLIQEPDYAANCWDISDYCKAVLATIHFHLWHGVVCFVVFRRADEMASISRLFDFGAIGRNVVFDTSTYYEKKFNKFARLEGNTAHVFVQRAISSVPRHYGHKPIKLYYDINTFSGHRRHDRQWQEIRNFLIRLYSGVCQGPAECNDHRPPPNEIEIDHILPLGNSNNVLINLRPLCKRCNRLKGHRNTREEPFRNLFAKIPDKFATREIQRVMSDESPGWLGRYRKPPNRMSAYIPNS